MSTFLLLGFCYLIVFAYAEARNPGVTLTLSSKGLIYAVECAIDHLKRSLLRHGVPDYRDTNGKLSYHLYGTRVTSFAKPESSLVTNVDGVTLSLSNLSIQLSGRWSYEYKLYFIPIEDSGTFDVSVNRVSIKLSVHIGVDNTGKPTVSTGSCQAVVVGTDVKFHGGASWIYNLFTPNIEKKLADHLQFKLCDDLDKLVNVHAEKKLQKTKFLMPLGHYLLVDYSLVAKPMFTASSLEFLHVGEIYMRNKSRIETPFLPLPIKYRPVETKALMLCLTEYVGNSGFYALFTNKRQTLMHNLTKEDLPKIGRHFLETRSFPQLAKEFPNSTIVLYMFATKSPYCHFINDMIVCGVQGRINFRIQKPNAEFTDWFLLDLKCKLIINVTLIDQRITAKVKHYQFRSNMLKKKLDLPSKQLVNVLIKFVFSSFIVPSVNGLAKHGLPLPSVKGIQYIDPELHIQNGSLCLAVDLKYIPDL